MNLDFFKESSLLSNNQTDINDTSSGEFASFNIFSSNYCIDSDNSSELDFFKLNEPEIYEESTNKGDSTNKSKEEEKKYERINNKLQFARSDVDPISSMNVLNDVKQEIEDLGYDAVIDQIISWCFLGDSKQNTDASKRKFIRSRKDKTEDQIKAMVGSLEPGQTQLPRRKRIELSKKIGLSESQIYKWFYDTYKQTEYSS